MCSRRTRARKALFAENGIDAALNGDWHGLIAATQDFIARQSACNLAIGGFDLFRALKQCRGGPRRLQKRALEVGDAVFQTRGGFFGSIESAVKISDLLLKFDERDALIGIGRRASDDLDSEFLLPAERTNYAIDLLGKAHSVFARKDQRRTRPLGEIFITLAGFFGR